MLWTIAVILLLLWAVGMVSSYTLGGFIHLLLLLAIIVVLIRVIQGRSPVVWRVAREEGLPHMKGTIIAGIVLTVLGVLALAYQGITYTQQKKVIDLGPIQASTKTEKHIPIPPILGLAAIGGGVALLITGGRQS
jgi:Family of unknown function (DUF5670)